MKQRKRHRSHEQGHKQLMWAIDVACQTHGQQWVSVSVFVCIFALLAANTYAGEPEHEISRIAGRLKPIPSEEWNRVVSGKSGDVYEVQKGDTLWDVSKTLFGNAFYWAKVWTFNNKGIGNPHRIYPGQRLVFLGGGADHFPSLSDGRTGENFGRAMEHVSKADVEAEEKRGFHEYDKLSPATWAPEDVVLPSDIAMASIDRDLKIEFDSKIDFRVPALVNDTTLPHLGEIESARREGTSLGTNEIVFVRSNGQDLQVGATYAIFSSPQHVSEGRSDRTGFAYHSIGELKIIGVKDGLYVAEIFKAYDVIGRGDRLYPVLPLISDISPKAAKSPIEGVALLNSKVSVSNVSQYQFVFFDRGLEDGVEPGHVFRIYDYYDPVTGKKITDSDFLVSADVMVVHATAQFSTGLVLRSRSTVQQGEFGVLLTDISDLTRRRKHSAKAVFQSEEKPGDKDLDDLDVLDKKSGEGMGRHEEKEVKELDQWDKTKDLDSKLPSDAQPVVKPEPLEPLEPATGGESLDSVERGSLDMGPTSPTDPSAPTGQDGSKLQEPPLPETLEPTFQ